MSNGATKDKAKYIGKLEARGYKAVKSRRSSHVKIYDGDNLVTVISSRNHGGFAATDRYVAEYERTKAGETGVLGDMPENRQKNTSTAK